jgi:hypothetical protein
MDLYIQCTLSSLAVDLKGTSGYLQITPDIFITMHHIRMILAAISTNILTYDWVNFGGFWSINGGTQNDQFGAFFAVLAFNIEYLGKYLHYPKDSLRSFIL